jgi:hypothetical protein
MTNEIERSGVVASGDGSEYSPAMKRIFTKLAEEGGGTWATYMMIEIDDATAALASPAQEPTGPITELQDFCLRYLLPEPYKATYASSGNPSYDNPTEHHSEVQRHRMIWRRDRAFISDVIHVLDTTPRHAPASPQPVINPTHSQVAGTPGLLTDPAPADRSMGIEDEIASVVQSVNEWDDRTSPDEYPEHLLITSEELTLILRTFAATLGGRNDA